MKSRISKRGRRVMAGAVVIFSATRGAHAVTNFVWTGAAGDANWNTFSNWIEPASGVPSTYPGNSTNQGANVVFSDSTFDNLAANYAVPVLPSSISLSQNLVFGNINFGASNSSFGVYTLSSNLSIGTAGTTITLNSSTGSINRLGSGVENLSGGNYNGSVYAGTSGVQTFASNILANASTSWTISGTSGEVLFNGTVGTTKSSYTITKSGSGEVELNNNNSSSLIGTYAALEGITLLDNNGALGSGTSTVAVSGSSAVNNASLLTNSGVTFGHNTTVAAPSGITATLGGASGQTSSTWSGTVALSSGVQLTGGVTGTTTFSGIISGAYPVTKVDFGTVVLTGANTYTGQTTINSGTLNVGGSTSTGSISSSSALVLGGGSLVYSRTGGTTQQFASTSISAGASAITDSVSTDTLALNQITPIAGATVDFTATGSITTKTNNTNGILGGWATAGSGSSWATSAAVGTTAGNITPLAAASYASDTWAASNNTTVTVPETFSAGSYSTTNSLRFNSPSATTVTLSSTSTNIISSGGILVTPNVSANPTSISGGFLQGAPATQGGDLIINQYDTAAALTISSVIQNNGTSTGLVKSGGGQLILAGSNTFNGNTYINGGTVSVGASNTAFNASAGIVVATGATLDFSASTLNQTIGSLASTSGGAGTVLLGTNTLTLTGSSTTTFGGSINGSGGVTLAGSPTLTLSGNSTYTGATNISAGTLVAGSSSVGTTSGPLGVNSALILGTGANAGLNLSNFSVAVGSLTGGSASGGNIILGNGTLTVGGDSTSPPAYLGAINGSGGLTKIGSGNLILGGTNTYSGITNISGGTITAASNSSLGNNSALILANTSGVALNLNGYNASVASITGGGGSGGNINLGSGNLTITGSTTPPAFAGAITGTGSLIKTGSGTLTLSNTNNNYSGGTTVQNGTLSIANFSALGNPSGLITLGNSNGSTTGEVLYTGATATVNYNFSSQVSGTANAGGGFISVNNAATVLTIGPSSTVTGNGKFRVGGVGSTILDAALTQTNSIALTASLVKSDAGTLEIGNASNTYNGGTSIQNGTVLVDYPGSLGASGSTVSVGASASTAGANPSLLTNFSGGSANISQAILVYNISSGTGVTTLGASASQNDSSGFTGQVALQRPVTLTSGVGSTVNFSNLIQDAGAGLGVTITGTGTVIFSGASDGGAANTYSGTTLVNSGTLTGTITQAFGTGNLVVNPTGTTGTTADAATVNTTGSLSQSANVTVNTNSPTAVGTVNFNGTTETIGLLSGSGNVVLANPAGTSLTVGTSGNSLFSGQISDTSVQGGGAGSLIKAGNGIFNLAGGSTYTGGTNVSAGTLVVTNSTGSATGSGPVTVNSGAFLGGSGIIAGPVTVAANGTIAPGISSNQSATTLTIGSGSSLLGNTNIDLIGNGSNDEIVFNNGTGSVVLGGTLTVTDTTGFALVSPESFTIFQFGSSTGSFSSTNLPGLTTGLAWNTSQLYTNGILSIGASATSGVWASNASSGFWETAGNWVASTQATGAGQTATFGDSIGTGAATVTLQQPESIGILNFNGSAGGSYTLTGASLALSSGGSFPAQILVNSGNQTINNPISLNSTGANINTASGSSLTLGGIVSGTGPLAVTNGSSVVVSATGAIGAPLVVAGNLSFANNPTGSTVLVRTVVPSLNVSGTVNVAAGSHAGRQLIQIGSGGLTNTGLIDLNNNDLVLQAGGTAGLGQITNLIRQGYNGGNWQGNGGAIISSAAAADSTHLTTLGVFLNTSTGGASSNSSTPSSIYSSFDGTSTSSGDVLVKYTYFGDADLSGSIDGTDYSRIDNGALLHLTGWQNGDFNYDGVIDGSDYTLIDNAFNTQGASLASEVADPSATATSQIAGSGPISAVPEPAALRLIGMMSAGLLGRRRRR